MAAAIPCRPKKAAAESLGHRIGHEHVEECAAPILAAPRDCVQKKNHRKIRMLVRTLPWADASRPVGAEEHGKMTAAVNANLEGMGYLRTGDCARHL